MPTVWYQGRVAAMSHLSKTTMEMKLEIDQAEGVFDFLPGQFITMDLPVSEKRLHRWRSYSIANGPDESNILELCIVRSPEGLGTKYLFEEVKIGTMIKFKGPDGGFVLPDDLSAEIIMVCTGTGVAPFRSMINYIKANKLPFKGIHLIFGTRSEENILYREEFEMFSKENPLFRYSVAFSRESKPGYHHGYIHDIYLKEYNHPHAKRQFYICGWSKMIDEAVANLLINLKYDKSQIHYELYG
ncbi:MAG: FAD-dependent oxidoreductase [Saprospiraceae bacterium]|nr:FAD-dependent oxidoreductase [Saprospiraceae bacterium]